MTKYKNPPIIERALVVHAKLTEERFRLAAEAWQSLVKDDFPHSESVTEWLLSVTESNGMPVLDPERQTMTVRQTFWKKADEKKDVGMQLWPDKIAFNLLGGHGNPRHFEELEKLAKSWLPRWADHFEVTTFAGISLQYVNLLSDLTLPDFIDSGALNVGQVLTFFHVPGQLQKLLPPFDFQINLDGATDPSSILGMQLSAPPVVAAHGKVPKAPTLHLRFNATTHMNPEREIVLDQVWKEVQICHDLILREFEATFSEKAKKSFSPYAFDSTAA